MAISEADRHALHDHFISQMGEHLAGELMHELIHEVDWGEFATKHHLAVLQRDFSGLRQDMLALEIRLNQRFDERLDDKLGALRGELRTEIQLYRRQTLALAGLMTAGWGAVPALVGVG